MLSSTSPLSTTIIGGGETELKNASQSQSNRNSSHSNHAQQSPKVTSVYNGRRKSSLSYQQHLQLVTAAGVDGIIASSGCSKSSLSDYNINGGSCSSPNHHYSNAAHSNETPNYMQHHQHHHHAKLSLHPIDRYDETLTCCLPPPSPAPTSDRFVMGIPSPTNSPVAGAIGSSNSLHHHNHNHSHIHNHFSNFGESSTASVAAISSTLNLTQQQQQSLSSPSSASTISTASSGGSGTGVTGNDSAEIGGGNSQQHQQLTAALSNVAGLMLSQKYSSSANSVSTLQRSISPNSRIRMSDRFREQLTPKCQLEHAAGSSTSGSSSLSSSSSSRFVTSSHFLTQNASLVTSGDAYSYLSSAVHTPVKRYVPTPPPPTELYTADISMSIQQPLPPAGVASQSSSSSHQQLPHSLQQQQHSTAGIINTLPYRFRMKCCAESTHQQQLPHTTPPLTNQNMHDHRGNMVAAVDYYATSPRTRLSYKSNGSGGNSGVVGGSTTNSCNGKDSPLGMMISEPQQQLSINAQAKSCNSSIASSSTSSSSATSGNSSAVSPVMVGTNSRPALRSSCMTMNDYVSRTPSIEYINTTTSTNSSNMLTSGGAGRVMTPVNVLSALDSINSSGGNTGVGINLGTTGTCLHCNTMRRTTGVHQTTQTTGPISPVPTQQQQQLLSSNGIYSNSNHPNLELTSSAASTTSTSESHISPLSPLSQKIEQEKAAVDSCQEQNIQQQQQSQLYQQQHYPQQHQRQQHQQRQILSSQQNMIERNNIINVQQQQQQQQHQQSVDNHQLSQLATQDQQHYHQQQQSPQLQQHQPSLPLQQQQRYSRKQRINQYFRKEIGKFFGVDIQSESEERAKWYGRQRRLALRRFGVLKLDNEISTAVGGISSNDDSAGRYVTDGGGGGVARSYRRNGNGHGHGNNHHHHHNYHHASERPDILPAQDAGGRKANERQLGGGRKHLGNRHSSHYINADFHMDDHVERKASVPSMFISGLGYIIQTLNKRQTRTRRQWSRSFAPAHVTNINGGENPSDICEGLTTLQEEEVFFDSPGNDPQNHSMANGNGVIVSDSSATSISPANGGGGVLGGVRATTSGANSKLIEHQRQLYMGERVHGWRTSAIIGMHSVDQSLAPQQQQQQHAVSVVQQQPNQQQQQLRNRTRCNRIASQILDGVLENSRRPLAKRVKLFSINDLDDRNDHRPFFTYWINTVQILVLFLSLICYGIGPIGFGVEQKTGQVLVTSLSLQTVQHQEQRNVWIGPRNSDLVHMGAKFATCMRRDLKIMDVLLKTRRQERETACCIRNDDSGCVQSSQADCSVRGLFPTKSISTWKKWSPGESGPGGRISGSVCGLDPKYCDAPASIAPYEWPDDITKWPICRKTNSFSQRFRYKDHTAEHMVCEVIGHPCCTGVFGECRITTREYCDFVNGYFHEEASLCSQISCLNNVCGMFPFFSIEVPDQFYRLFTSLCLHAGILHLAITVAFQHVFLADLERLIGPIRTAIVYIGSGLAGNLTSAVLVPYKPEVGPLASLSGVIASLVVLLILMHWKQLHKPHVALFKLIFIGGLLFGVGTLPWQLNFAGLLAGILCGIFLTIALVPFVSITKYGRKAKINLIWSCIVFHLFVYTVMLIIFYLFPTELTNLNFGEVFSGNFNTNAGLADNSGGASTGGSSGSGSGFESLSNNVMTSNSNKHHQQQQYHHHHHSDDIVGNNALNSENSNTAHLLQSQVQPQVFFNLNYHTSRSNSNSNIIVNNKILFYESSSKHNNFINNNSNNKNNNSKAKSAINYHSSYKAANEFFNANNNNSKSNILNYNNVEQQHSNNNKQVKNYNLSKNYKNFFSSSGNNSSSNSNSNNNRNSKNALRYINSNSTSVSQNNRNSNNNQQLQINNGNTAISSSSNNNKENKQQHINSDNSNINPSIAAVHEQQRRVELLENVIDAADTNDNETVMKAMPEMEQLLSALDSNNITRY